MTTEYMDVSEDYSALGQLDERDTKVKESVVAYLMWHSGEILNDSVYPDRQSRADRIDSLGELAINRFSNPKHITKDKRRVLATKSILTQSHSSREDNPNSIVCNLDAEMIEGGYMIAVYSIDEGLDEEFNLTCPSELGEVGFKFKNYDTFRKKYENLGTYLRTDPMTVLHMLEALQGLFFEKSITNFEKLSTFHTLVPHWNIVGTPKGCERSFEGVSHAYDAGKLITIQGQVSEVGDTMVVYTKIAYRCRTYEIDTDGNKTDKRCNTINLVNQNAEEGMVLKPLECSRCKGKDFIKLDSEKSRIEPVQRIQLQEIDISEEPKAIMVELRGNLTKQLKAGSTVEITGILRLQTIAKNSLMNTIYILGQSVRVVSEETFTMELTTVDKEEVKTFASENTLEDRMTKLCSAWIGRLLCDKEIKSAMMLQAVGAPENAFGHRTGIHILLAGDPGTAKTLLLHAVSEILPGSRYIDASAATAAGVTASAEQIEDFYTGKTRWGLRPGIIALTPKSVCSLDELNLYKGDLGDIHTALESGKITKTTGPVKGTLRADCSILAGANPMDGDNKKFIVGRPFTKQIGMSIPMLQRFDLIFVLLDKANKATDEAIAMSILGYGENSTTNITVDFVQKYIAMAKTIQPKFTKEAAEYISKSHSDKRSKKGDYIRSHRLVPALQRLSLATARFDFSEEVTIEHVVYAETVCSKSLNEKDPGASQGAHYEETLIKKQNTTKHVIAFMESKHTSGLNHPIPQPELKKYLKTKGVAFDNDSALRTALGEIPNLHNKDNGWLYLKEE